jgi:hypothetical protein
MIWIGERDLRTTPRDRNLEGKKPTRRVLGGRLEASSRASAKHKIILDKYDVASLTNSNLAFFEKRTYTGCRKTADHKSI